MIYNYDVAVIGAGPAGLSASIIAAKKGLKTILIEKNPEIGYPQKTSAITWREVINSWNLPNNVMYQWYNSFYIKSVHSDKDIEINFNKNVIGALNYHLFLKHLAFISASCGTKILLSEKIKEPIIKDDYIVGVISKNKNIYSKIVIDCSGPFSIIGKILGKLPDFRNIEIGIGKEYEMTNFKVRNPNSMDFFVGEKEVVPIGYGWVFPLSKDQARVGISTVYNTPEKIKKRNIDFWLEKFFSKSSPIYERTINAQPYEMHFGNYPLCGILEKPFHNGMIMAGDSAAQSSMLLGEGIRFALEFGKLAAITASDAIERKDYSKEFLYLYIKRCNNFLGETFNVASDLLQIPTNEYWDVIVNNFIRIKNKNGADLVIKYLKTAMNYKDAKKLFPEFAGKYLK